MVSVVSSRTVRPPPRPRRRIPLTTWDIPMLSANYIQKGLLFHKPTPTCTLLPTTAHVVDHLAAALADALVHYYPVAGRFVTDRHYGEGGQGDVVVGCSVSIDCDGQGVQVVHAVADEGVSMADVIPPDVDVPPVVQSFFLLDGAINYDGRDHPLLAVQVTDLADGVFVGFSYNHALSDGTAFWGFINAWAEIARARLLGSQREQPLRRPLLDRWSPDGGVAAPVVLPCAQVSDLIERTPQTPLRERMLHFSSESLAALKERARQDLLAAGDAQGAAALTRFQVLTSLLWRCITRARRLSPEKETTCRAAINNRGRLRPELPTEYFGNAISTICTEAVRAPELLERGHGWAAAAVGRAVAAHTDTAIRERVAALTTAKTPGKTPPAYMMSWHDPCGTLMGSSPRFDMFGCDFGWGKPVAARSGKANKVDGGTSLYPCRDGGGGMDGETAAQNSWSFSSAAMCMLGY